MISKKFAFAFFATTFAIASECAQAGVQSSAIQARCNEMSSKLLSGDLQGGVQYVLPRLVELVGGPELAMTMLRESVTDRGKSMEMKITCLAPTQFAKVGNNSFALIPTISVTSGVKDGHRGKLFLEGSSLGVSVDEGVTWHFLDLHGDEPIPETLIPGGIGSIKPPAKRPGTFKAD
jgi:hypothetical protein